MCQMLLQQFVFSQQQNLKFREQLFDFGEVHLWNTPPAQFTFTNTGSDEILFLPTFPQNDIFVDLPKDKIKPGENDTISIYYFTSFTGEFLRSVELFTSDSGFPLQLTLRGNILSLDPKAFIICPGFAPKENRADELSLTADSLFQAQSEQQTSEQQTSDTMVLESDEAVVLAITDDRALLPLSKYTPNNVVFLIDVSSSMKKPNKLPLLKSSMKKLTSVLRKVDYISLITYSSTSTVMLHPTRADDKAKIITLIDTLKASGTTNGVKGLETAYNIAEQNFIPDGNNQIILATDGLFNNPGYSENEMFSLSRQKAKNGIILSVVGFGQDETAIRMMKKLAYKGKGNFIQIPDMDAAEKILIDEIKLQSEITP